MREHENEPVLGLPERLPEGEAVLWQGAPSRASLRRRALHVPMLALYFGLLSVARGVATWMDGTPVASAAFDALWLALPASVVIAFLSAFAWFTVRTTVYTITNRRVVMRIGVALSMTVNIPFSRIEAAALKVNADGTGDLSLRLAEANNIAYIFLWPHVRPWHFSRAEPTLRAIPQVEAVAQTLARALAASAEMPVQAMTSARGVGAADGASSRSSAAAAA